VIVGEGNFPEEFVEPVGPRYMYVKRHSWVSRLFSPKEWLPGGREELILSRCRK